MATGDVVELWINSVRSTHTARAYRSEAKRFLDFVGKPITDVDLNDLQKFSAHLVSLGLSPGSRRRAIAAVKSLFAFATRLGELQIDVARPIRMPTEQDRLNERILEEEEVRAMINGEKDPRDRAILQLLYNIGERVSELVSLKWKHAKPRDDGGQLTIFGKGAKTRTVRIEKAMWDTLNALRGNADGSKPIFPSRKGGHLSSSQIFRIVRRAAVRAGIDRGVSPHWLRHCHASHALDHGAPIHLLQATLGHASAATTSKYLHARPGESSSRFVPEV